MPEALWGNLPNAIVTDLNPLIVTSPTPRCGTTLVQRLLCSSTNALIYGEKCAQELEFFLQLYTFKAQEYGYHRQTYQENLSKVLSGEVNDWILDLTPDVDGYLLAMQKGAFAGVRYCREYAALQGRDVWGFKHPGWSPVFINLLHQLMPEARTLVICRDLPACLRSAKAQRMLDSEQAVREFCESWKQGMAYWNHKEGETGMMIVNYDDLVQNPGSLLQRISAFSGVEGMQASILEEKVNIWKGREFANQTSDGYIAPAELSAGELQIMEAVMAGTPFEGTRSPEVIQPERR